MIRHDYPYDEVDTNPDTMKQQSVLKRTPQPIPLTKIRGREDNLMYKVSDGYNLEDAGKQTYFDKYNVMELLSIGGATANRSPARRNSPTNTNSLNNSSSIEAIKRYKSTSSTLNIMVQRHHQVQRQQVSTG